ncbi:unnamed protein product, partial [Effrenium voratum]
SLRNARVGGAAAMDGAASFQNLRYAKALVGRLLHPLPSAGASERSERKRDTFHEAYASEELLTSVGAKLGDWLLVLPSRGNAFPSDACWVRSVGSEEVLALAPPGQPKELPLVHLPAGLIEFLGLTPGRSEVSIAWQEALEPPRGTRLVLSAVGGAACASALKTFFHVPRVLCKGEVFSVPLRGVPAQLCDIELAENPRCHADETEVFQTAPRFGACQATTGDPLHGFTFCPLQSFKVETFQGGASQSFCVDSSAEIVLKGTSQARAIPYARSHLFCQAPSPVLPSLRPLVERLLGMLVPAVRAWQLGRPVPELPAVLMVGPRGCGKRVLWRTVAERLGLHLLEVNCALLVDNAESRVQECCEEAAALSPCLLCFRRVQAWSRIGPAISPAATLLQQRRIQEALETALARARTTMEPKGRMPLVLVGGSCEDLEDVGGPLRQAFRLELTLARPTEDQRHFAVSRLMTSFGTEASSKPLPNGQPEESKPLGATIAKLTAGLSYSDIRSVCAELMLSHPSAGPDTAAGPELQHGIEQAVKRLQGGSKVAVTLASKVQWADVGGLQDAKEEIMNCITLPLSQGDMFAGEKVRSGVLLFGPPGTGKTLLAKAVATECKVHFLSVKGPELLSMYIGESEKNVRSLFQNGRDLAPCVLFFDELDSLAPARGRGSDSGGVMDRVVSQLVTELDNMPATVFMVGATNRPDLLDRSLLRPGRLDRMVYLGVAKNKLPLLKAITRKFVLDDGDADVLVNVAKACPPNLTGADVSVLCADAYSIAQRQHIAKLHELADALQVTISTLLLFLDTLEAHLATLTTRTLQMLCPEASNLASVFPPPQLGKSGAGIVVYGSASCQAVVLAHHVGGPSGSFRDVSAAVGLVKQDGPTDAGQRWTATCGGLAPALKMVRGFSVLQPLLVRVAARHFQEALSNLQPSVPLEDLQRYEQLRGEYQNIKQ